MKSPFRTSYHVHSRFHLQPPVLPRNNHIARLQIETNGSYNIGLGLREAGQTWPFFSPDERWADEEEEEEAHHKSQEISREDEISPSAAAASFIEVHVPMPVVCSIGESIRRLQ